MRSALENTLLNAEMMIQSAKEQAITLEKEISNLKRELRDLKKPSSVPEGWSWYYANSRDVPPEVEAAKKPIVFQDTPCTAELEIKLEVKLEKLAKNFERWYEEYKRHEDEGGTISVFAQGKQEAYRIAAERLREILNYVKYIRTSEPKPTEEWIVERDFIGRGWGRSGSYGLVYTSKSEAEKAFSDYPVQSKYRAVQQK